MTIKTPEEEALLAADLALYRWGHATMAAITARTGLSLEEHSEAMKQRLKEHAALKAEHTRAMAAYVASLETR